MFPLTASFKVSVVRSREVSQQEPPEAFNLREVYMDMSVVIARVLGDSHMPPSPCALGAPRHKLNNRSRRVIYLTRIWLQNLRSSSFKSNRIMLLSTKQFHKKMGVWRVDVPGPADVRFKKSNEPQALLTRHLQIGPELRHFLQGPLSNPPTPCE